MSSSAKWICLFVCLPLCLFVHPSIAADEAANAAAESTEQCSEGRCTTSYTASFFSRYAPTNALDMVENLPGFTLDDGDEGVRGFGGAAGNLLVDGERLSSKSEKPSDFLSRIPASQVERVVLIRGQRGGLDLGNQTVVANVVRKQGSISGTWRASASQYTPDSVVYPFGVMSVAGVVGETRFDLGIEIGEFASFVDREERVTDAMGQLVEFRDEVSDENGDFLNLSSVLARNFGATKADLNISYVEWNESEAELSERVPSGLDLLQGEKEGEDKWELGFDLERSFGAAWQGKLIGLLRTSKFHQDAFLDRRPAGSEREPLFRTRFRSESDETILRVELDFSGIEGHLLETSLEAAVNELDSRFALSQLENGQLVPQIVPGAETQVKEERLDWLLSDSFQVGPLSVDLALGAERSKIEQNAAQGGGFNQSRTFFIWKPSVLVTYPLSDAVQLRSGIRREASQLDFFDFVSSADLGDEELQLGNPNLEPEKTVTWDVTYEHRFADNNGSVSLTLFQSWIDDVADLLPLQGVLEVPGNIGRGTRTGFNIDLTLPLDRAGLANGRLDAQGRWQISEVEDPLSGRDRDLSGEEPYAWRVTLRQDLPERRVAWSIETFATGAAPEFGLDELESRGQRLDMDAFVEFRVTSNLNFEVGVENLLRDGRDRRRRVFNGPRTAGELDFKEVREQRFAREFYVRLSGAF